MDLELLRSLGLTEAEINVYLTLLKRGILSASQISGLTKIHRTNVYDLLDKLTQKGLVTFSIKERKKYFKASEPKHISHYFEERLLSLKNKKDQLNPLINKLEKIQEVPKKIQEVEMYSGKNGLKSFYEELAKEITLKDEFYYLGSSGKVFDLLEFYFPKYIKRIMKLKLKGYLLANKSIIQHKLYFESKKIKVRFLPDEYEPTTTFIVIKDKIGIYNITDEEDPFIILIRSPLVAKSYKQQFKLMWDFSEKIFSQNVLNKTKKSS
jgi:sugar-specific transcriptional regulator TrmB